jgi:hypothetical protein
MELTISMNRTYNCSEAFSGWHGPGYLHERDLRGGLFCGLAAEESGQRLILGVVDEHRGLEDGFVRRAFFEGMVLRGRKAGFLHVLLEAALEHVAILNPCAEQQVKKKKSIEALNVRAVFRSGAGPPPAVGVSKKM